jgi:DNA-binding NarL/FixJ family response regulator
MPSIATIRMSRSWTYACRSWRASRRVQRMRERDPNAKVIVLTTYDTDEDIARALQAGAKAYVMKDISAAALVACIHDVLAGKT